jgi:hypothetical protein
MKWVVCFAVIMSMLSGCTAGFMSVVPASRTYDTFNLGQQQTKMVGEVMVARGNVTAYPGFVARLEYTPPAFMATSYPTIAKGSVWECKYALENGNYACSNPSAGGLRHFGKPDGHLYYIVITPDGSLIGYSNAIHVQNWNETPTGLFDKFEIPEKGSIKEELIYNGKSKDIIKVSYREYRNEFARPAFYQDLSYDIAESKTVGFRGMMIEVMEATNQSITFVVKSEMTK